VDELISLLYRAVIDEDAASSLPDAFRRVFGAGSATTFAFDGGSGQPLGRLLTTHSVESGAAYAAHYHRLDPWHAPTMTRIGRPVLGSEMVADRVLARSEFYNDFARKTGTFHMLILAMPLGGVRSGRFVNLSINRPEQREPFGAEGLERLAVIAPHLQRAMELRHEVAVWRQRLVEATVEAALDLVPHPAFVTDGHGRVRYANGMARGVRGLVDRGGLSLADRLDAPRLRRAIADAARGGVGGTVLSGGSVITAGRLPGSFAPLADVAGLVLVVVRPLVEDRGALARRCVAALGLTAAEADVVAGIAAGETPAAVAAGRGVGVATVRTLIRRALDKTGCAGLRELTGLVLRLPAGPS
jgi:DNA-binding CsgD family transcriptional regulator